MKKFSGIMPPLVTAFNDDETFNEKNMKAHVNWIIENGVHGISPVGSTGEFITMQLDEQKRVIEVVTTEAAGRVQVYAGTGSYSTKIAVELSKFAEKAGANGLLIINPYYIQPPVEDVKIHFRTIREAVSIPIMLYQNPHVCGYQLSTMDLVELGEEGVIQSVKVANGPASEVVDLINLSKGTVDAIYGADPEAPEALLMGAQGWITSFINVAPKLCRDLYEAASAGDCPKTQEIWAKFIPFFQFAYSGKTHWLQCVKSALHIMGKDIGAPRKPVRLLEGSMKEELTQILKGMDLI
jgi:4-hydroxy-tetrahydrodipicolinate synthase